MTEQTAPEITNDMVLAGWGAFCRWFDLPENSEALVELPSAHLVDQLARDMFSAMAAAAPEPPPIAP